MDDHQKSWHIKTYAAFISVKGSAYSVAAFAGFGLRAEPARVASRSNPLCVFVRGPDAAPAKLEAGPSGCARTNAAPPQGVGNGPRPKTGPEAVADPRHDAAASAGDQAAAAFQSRDRRVRGAGAAAESAARGGRSRSRPGRAAR